MAKHNNMPEDTSEKQIGTQTEAQKQPEVAIPLWSLPFVLIVCYSLCLSTISQGLNSGNAVYLDVLGFSAATAGILAACFSIGAGTTRFLIGPFVQKFPRRRLLIIGSTLLTIGAFAPLFYNTLIALACWRILVGIGFAIGGTTAATAVAEVLPLARLGEGLSYNGIGQALSTAIGPALAVILISTNPENLFVGFGCFAIMTLLIALVLRYEKNPASLPKTAATRTRWEEEQAAKAAAAQAAAAQSAADQAAAQASDNASGGKKESDGAIANSIAAKKDNDTNPEQKKPRGIFLFFEPKAMAGVLPMLVMSVVSGFTIYFISLYGTTIGIVNPGLFYTVSAVTMILSRLTLNKQMDSVGPYILQIPTTICGIISYILLFVSSGNSALFYVAGAFWGFYLGIIFPLNQSVAIKNTPSNRWGVASALFFLSLDIGTGIGALVWGYVIDATSFGFAIICCAITLAFMAVVAWFTYPGHGLKPLKSVDLKDED